MDLSSPKVTNEEKINLCSKYFKEHDIYLVQMKNL